MMGKLLALKNNAGFMRFYRNTSWLFFEKALKLVVGLVVGAWVARYLGPERLGVLNYSQSLVAMFGAVATLGLDGILVRELSKSLGDRDRLLGTAFVLKVISSFFLLVFITVFLLYIEEESIVRAIVFFLSLATIFHGFNVVDIYFQSKVLSRFSVFSGLIVLTTSSVCKILLILSEVSVLYFSLVVLFDAIMLAIGLTFFYRKMGLSIFSWQFDRELASRLLLNSWPLIVGGVAAAVYINIDQVMIKHMLDDRAVGVYSVAARLADAFLFFSVLVTQSLLPSIISAKEESDELFRFRMRYLYGLLVKVAFFVSVFVAFLSDYFILLLYGVEYSDSSNILSLYVWSLVFVFLSNASTSYFLVKNMVFHSCGRLVLGALANVFLNYLWVDSFGLVGAAWATIVSYSMSSYFYNALFPSTRENFIMQTWAIFNIFNPVSYYRLAYVR